MESALPAAAARYIRCLSDWDCFVDQIVPVIAGGAFGKITHRMIKTAFPSTTNIAASLAGAGAGVTATYIVKTMVSAETSGTTGKLVSFVGAGAGTIMNLLVQSTIPIRIGGSIAGRTIGLIGAAMGSATGHFVKYFSSAIAAVAPPMPSMQTVAVSVLLGAGVAFGILGLPAVVKKVIGACRRRAMNLG